jgi:hypothetical protein
VGGVQTPIEQLRHRLRAFAEAREWQRYHTVGHPSPQFYVSTYSSNT